MYDSEMLLCAIALGTFSAIVIFGIIPILMEGYFDMYALLIIVVTVVSWVWFAHTARHW